MKIIIHPAYSHLKPFLQELPHRFKYGGQVLHHGRNVIKLFNIKGLKLVVKSYGRPHLLNRWAYANLRHSKAHRAYEYATRLQMLNIKTPQEVAYIEITRHGLLCESYFVSLYSEGQPFAQAIQAYPNPEARKIIDAFIPFVAQLHQNGILHEDLNANNVLYQLTPKGYQFELIDTNRMRFVHTPTDRQCLENLRRLTHNTPPYFYIIEQYARLTNRDINQTLLRSSILLLSFSRWVHWKEKRKVAKRHF